MHQEMPSLKQKLESKLLQKPTKWNNEQADYIFSYGGKITDLILKEFKVSRANVLDFTSGLNQDWLRPKEDITENTVRKFVFMGRDEERKGIADLNHVLQELLHDLNFEFHLIGPMPPPKQLEGPKFIYHGELRSKEAICQVLDQMDVLVCPSHAEGMPNVILDGMARGLAVIAKDVGAVEMLVDETNGLLIPPLKTEQLKNALLSFIEMEQHLLQKLKLNSVVKIETDFLWDKLILNMSSKITDAIK